MKKWIFAFLLCVMMAFSVSPTAPVAEMFTLQASAAARVESLEVFSSLSSGKLTMTAGAEETFKIMVLPSSATNKQLKWSSSATSIVSVSDAAVSSSGIASAKLTALKEGTAKITYSTTDGSDISGSFTVVVQPLVKSLTLNQEVKSITRTAEGEKLVATVSPSDAGNQKLRWFSSDESVCKVDYNGVLYPVSNGECYISVATTDGSDIVKTCRLVVAERAKSLTVSRTSGTLENGNSLTVYATVTTADGSKHDAVKWTSSNTKVATVNQDGVVTAKYPGSATITATTADGTGKTASCKITVTQKITGISLSQSATVGIGKTVTLKATITPSYATDKNVIWSSSDTSVATVSAGGVVTGRKVGTVTITCKTADGRISDTCTVRVVVPATGISISTAESELWKGESLQLEAVVTPSNATDKSVTWTSTNTAVATVTPNGLVVAVAGGSCNIIAKNSEGQMVSCKITVFENATGIEIDEIVKIMYEGQVDKLSANVLPLTATNRELTWHSSNSAVVTVDADGSLRALKTGSVVITAKAVDGGFTATCRITVEKKIPVTGVSLDRSSVSVKVGGTFQFIGMVTPSNASEKRIKWSSDNTAVATISSSGVLTGVKAGSAVITATSYDGNFTAKCKVSVVKAVTGISLTSSSAKIAVGKSKTLTYNLFPSDATNKAVTWSSSNTDVATVSNGIITARKAGSTVVTVKSVDGGFSAACNVTVYVPVTGVSVSVSSLKVPKGETRVVTAVIKPSTATDKTVKWSSSDPDVAKVNSSGRITGVAKGTATITCRTVDGSFRASCTVTVVQLVQKVKLDATLVNLQAGKYKTLKATVTPSSASSKTVKWKSSDKKVAQVSSKGVVKAIGAGTATITAYSADGNAEAKCTIKVTQPATGVKITASADFVKIGKTLTLKAKVSPSDATNKKVTWTSSNTKRATVSSKGVVKGKEQGYVTITATTANGAHKATYKVLVANAVTGIRLDKSSITMNVGKSTTITPTIAPKEATIKTVKWYSDNNDVATVDKNGKVTAKSSGYATITAKTVDGSFKAKASVYVVVPVKGVELNRKTAYLNSGSKAKLTASIAPSNATVKGVVWTTSNKDVATVSSTGVVKAKKRGTATITCTTKNGRKVATCKIYVVKRVTKVSLNYSSEILYFGDKLKLKATVYPVDATVKDITYTSSNKNVAKVSSKGVVTPLNVGTAKITVVSKDGSHKDVCKVTVKKAPESIRLGATKTSVVTGQSKTIKYAVYPADATNRKATFKSSNSKIVKVSSSGKITGVSKGKAKITATTENGLKAVCVVTVKQQVKSVELTPVATLYTGNSVKLKATVLPKDAENKKIKWSSSDSSVAKVSSSGTVTGVRAGTATITVTSVENSKLKATCKVTVKQHVTSLSFNEREVFLNNGGKLDLKYKLLPSDATNKKVTFTSSDSKIASVTNDGRVTAHKGGSVKITLTCADNKKLSAICYVTVVEPASGVSLDREEANVFVGSTLTLKATVSPSDAHNKLVRWSSDSEKASVNSKGVVTALKSGTAIITVTTVDGGYTATCKLNLLQRATSVKADKTKLTVTRGETYQLKTTVLPEDCYDKSYRWISADSAIATVTADGLITAVAPGKVKLTCKSLESGVSTTVEVTVHEPVTSVDIAESEETLYTPLNKKLTVSLLPANASDKSVTFASSDEEVVKVDKNGNVTAVGKGEAVVTATSNDTGVSDSCKFIILTGVEEIITDKNAYSLYENTSLKINYTLKPQVVDDDRIIFSSSDESIFTVSEDGTVTGIRPGNAKLTITSVQNADVKKELEISITRAVTGINISESEKVLYAGNNFTLSAEIIPADATDKTVIWTSSNENIVSVDASGKVTAKARGFAVVTATTRDGGFVSECSIEVIQLPTDVIPEQGGEITAYMGEILKLAVKVIPEDANDQTVAFNSSDETVAVVDGEGNITPVAPGTCYIMISTSVPEVGRRVRLTVIQLCEEIVFTSRVPELFPGEKAKVTADVLPSTTTDKRVVWSSSDESVATVDEGGVITAVNPGKVRITVKSLDEGGVSASFELDVKAYIDGIKFTSTKETIELGDSFVFEATVTPAQAYDKTVIFASSDSEVATVDETGKVTAVKTGTAVITATTADGKFTASANVTVIKSAEEIRLFRTEFELAEGGRVKVEYQVLPSYATQTDITWTSSDSAVATVDENGVITAVGKGTATITLNVTGTSIKNTVSVTVG